MSNDYTDYTDSEDYEDSEESNITPAEAILALAKEGAPSGSTSITFEGGSKHEQEAALKEASDDVDTIIAAHHGYTVTNTVTPFAGNDTVEIRYIPWRNGEWARALQHYVKDIAAPKQNDLFDDDEVAQRDALAARLGEQHDRPLYRGKSRTPIKLTSIECRVVYALFAIISRSEELKRDDVRRKILTPYAPNQEIKRLIPIEFFTRTIFDSNRRSEREVIWKALYSLANTYQYTRRRNGTWWKTTLIHLGEPQDTERPPRVAEITFGSSFFDGLNNRYAPIYPRTLFAAWRKAGRGTELFYRLLSELLNIYTATKIRERVIRERIRQETKGKATAADIERRARAEMQRKKLHYSHIKVETLKNKIERDYESEYRYTALFWRDLDAAIEGLKEIGIITAASSTAATAQPGTKRKLRPQQIVFTLNLDYDKAAAAVDTTAEEVAAAALPAKGHVVDSPRADLLLGVPRNITATDDTTDDVAEGT